jgi:hypothetical protein
MRHIPYEFLFLLSFLLSCTKEDRKEYFQSNLVMVIQVHEGKIDTTQTEFEDKYTQILSTERVGEDQVEFFKNNQSILRMRKKVIYSFDSVFIEQRIRIREFVTMDNEKTLFYPQIDTLVSGNWEFSNYFWDGYVLIRNFPFEGINCFKYED